MQTSNTPIKSKAKGFTIIVVIILVLLIALVLIFGAITQEIVIENESAFDNFVYSQVKKLTHPALTNFMVFFTFFGSRAFLLPAYTLIVIIQLLNKRRRSGIAVAAVALCGAGVLFLFKGFFKRARPLEPLIEKATSYSYPSGHSFSAFTLSGILIYLIWNTTLTRSWKWFWSIQLILFAIIIAFSRVYLHVHFASDIIAGFCLSLLWLAVCFYTLKKLGMIERK